MSDRRDASPYGRSFVVSVLVLALIAGGGVWLVVSRGSGDAQTGQAATPATVSTGEDSESSCGLPDGSQAVPTGPLGAATLQIAHGLEVPVVEGAGPGDTEGITRCFAHSPTGATVAAVNFLKWFSSRQQLDTVAQTLIVPDGDRDRMVSAIESEWDGSTASAFVIQGYKVEVRGPDEVLVTLAAALPTDVTQITSWPLVMVWQDGDWLVQLSPNDSWGEEPVTSVSGEGFTPWTI